MGFRRHAIALLAMISGVSTYGCADGAAGSAGRGDGGAPSSAGGASTGGSASTAGASATGGARAAGGTSASGGTPTNGGTSAGGVPSSGGIGGASTGGDSGASAGGNPGEPDSGAPSHTGPWKIMPLGDSITASTCYRGKLWDKLEQAGYTNLDFVGTRTGSGGCGVPSYDQDNEGHGGYVISDVLKATSTGRPPGADGNDPYLSSAADLDTWLGKSSPDVVLMHFGTNDVWNAVAPSKILQAYSALLAKLRTVSPRVIVLVAQIIPLAPSGCDHCDVKPLNAAIPSWASQNSTRASPIYVVDQYTGFDSAWTRDGVHPNDDQGSTAMANKWYDALVPRLSK